MIDNALIERIVKFANAVTVAGVMFYKHKLNADGTVHVGTSIFSAFESIP